MMTSSAEIIVFHGRFQPYHIGHHWVIKYLIENTTDPIIIGIINPDPWEIWQSDEPNFIRFAPSRNPLTYWDRYTCITRSISGLSCPERILGIVPLPRPSINFEKCKRFLPSKTLRFVLSLRYGDETERWKKEKYKSLGLELFIIVEEQIPEGIVPISGTMVRDLMATRDDTWKELVPEATIDYLGQTEVLNRVEQVIKSTDALDRIREFANKAPYSGWCQHFLSGYIEQEKSKMVEKKHKYDIIGAIAESLFSLFPVFKGLLRLRDDERRAKQEKAVLKAIREQGQNTVSEVEKILTKYEWNCDSLKSELFRQVYAESLLSVAKCKPNKHKASVL
ncbi:MAG: hypothetical protein KAV87_40655 [Desulfobacteraceae bacterium]|nr:hypothetical protein [Desulfobacteraceae bacterium]